jgi:glucokinase
LLRERGISVKNSAGMWAGLDIGGTGTRGALVDAEGSVVAGVTMSTRAFDERPTDGLADLVASLVPRGVRLLGIGIGASGPVDLMTGMIRNPDTLPQFTGLDVASALAREFAVPVWIDNDAVVAGLAESTWGTAAAAESVLCVTLGTGIGAAMIERGAPIRGADGQHPECGHIPVAGCGNPCYCGLPQCWEQVASRSAFDVLSGSGTYSDVELWTEYSARVASGLITLLTVFRPAAAVVGGSVAQHWSVLEAPLRQALSGFREFDPRLVLASSALGERAGALGASLLPRRKIGWCGNQTRA